jgi:C4-type Zn-finger protein
MCNRFYEIKNITYEQRVIEDEDFCPTCWHREITVFADGDMDFSYLEGILERIDGRKR